MVEINKTNIAEYFRKDITIVLPNGRTVSSDYLKTLKNFYKQQLYTKLDGKTVGKSVFIGGTNNFDVIVPAVQAIWELGANIAVHEFPYDLWNHPDFTGYFDHISALIAPPDLDQVMPHIPHIPAHETVCSLMDYKYDRPEQPVWQLQSEDYPDTDYELDQPTGLHTPCMVSFSASSYAGELTAIDHGTVIDMVHEQIRLGDFNQHDRVLHFKTLHHSSMFLNFGVPALITTSVHYYTMQKRSQNQLTHLESCMRLCQEHGLTKYLVPYDNIKLLAASIVDDVDLPQTSLFTIIGPSSDEMVSILKQFNLKDVYVNFGCYEIGAIAYSITDKNNMQDYSPHKFTHVNQLIDLEPEPYCFRVKYKKNSEWNYASDVVELSSDQFRWHRRNNSFECEHEPVDLTQVTKYLQQTFNTTDFFLVPDYKYQNLYLAWYDLNVDLSLSDVNRVLQTKFPSCQIHKMKRISITTESKPNIPMLLHTFRKRSP
jgi:hypothetical protein